MSTLKSTPIADPASFKATLSQLINALDSNFVSSADRDKLFETSWSLYSSAIWWADNIETVKFDAYDHQGERHSEKHPIYRPLRNQIYDVLRWSEITRIFWPGVLLKKERITGGRTTQLHHLNPNIWMPDISLTEGLRGFRIFATGLNYDADVEYLPRRNAVYMHDVDFNDDFAGVPPAQVAYMLAGLEVEIALSWLSFFRNKMMPYGVVQPAKEITTKGVGEDIRKRMADMLRRMTQGARNTGRTIVTDGRWEYLHFDQNVDKVPVGDFDNKIYVAVEYTTGVYRKLLSPGDTGYAEFEGLRRTWGHAKFVPRLNRWGLHLTEGLASEYNDVAEIRPRLEDIPFLKEDVASKTNNINSRVDGLTMDLYTAQRELGNQKPPEVLKDMYMVNGVPVHISRLPELADALLFHSGSEADEGGLLGLGEDPPAQLDDQPRLLPSPPQVERSIQHVPEDKLQELKNWRRVAERKNHKRPFEPQHLVGEAVADFIEEALASDHAVSDIFAVAGDMLRTNLSIDEAWDALEALKSQSNYRRGIRAAVRGLWSGALSLAEFEDTMASTIRRYFAEAWRRGIAAAGAEESDLTARDVERLQIEIAQEILYASSFGSDIEAASKANGGKLAPLYMRIEAWVDTYERIEYMAMAIAGRGIKYKWVRDPAKDSCDDCIHLDGRVYYGRVYERENVYPRCRKLNCGGHKCGCRLEKTDEPVTRGKFPRLRGPKSHVHITVDTLTGKGVGKPGLTAVARLADDPTLMDVLNLVYDATTSDIEAQWTDPADLHITLVSASLVTDAQAEAIVRRLPEAVAPFEIMTGELTTFEQDQYDVWVLSIDCPSLIEFQKLVYEAFQAEGVAVSKFSEPAEYKPHVTIAYVVKGAEQPPVQLIPSQAFVQEIHFTRSSYEPVHIIGGTTV